MKLTQINEIAAGPAAPTAPTRPMPTKPRPTMPGKPAPGKPRPDLDPFRPTRPKQDPAPKNRIKAMAKPAVQEAYEDETHPGARRYWSDLRNKKNLISQHPVLGMYGNDLSKASWEHSSSRAKQGGPGRNVMQAYMQTVQAERPHQKALVELAKDVVAQVWGVPRDILHAELTQQVDQNVSNDLEDEEMTKLAAQHMPHINKRLTMNLLSHGSAVHAMMTAHHVVDKQLNAINPNLVRMYSYIAAAAHEYYWQIDWEAMLAQLGQMAVGSAKVEYQPGEDGQDEPMIVAKAVIFPVLVQELSKGVAELISHHGLEDLDAETTKSVLYHADDIKNEPPLIQTGPEVWRRLLKFKPREVSLAQFKMKMARMDSHELHRFISAAMDDADRAQQYIDAMFAKPPEEEEEIDLGNEWQ